MTTAPISQAIERTSQLGVLDHPASLVTMLGESGGLRRRAERAAELLGHPLHPMLTDLPIGFWTSAWLLDLLPGRRSTANAARRLLGVGVVSAVPAALSGIGDAAGLDRTRRRIAALHGLCNAAATSAFACSWWMRRSSADSGRARLVAHLGAALAIAGGLLGGHLAFSDGAEAASDEQPDADRSAA